MEGLKDLKESSENISARDWHELVKVNEFRNYLTCAELVYQAALLREESRGDHYRQEFPFRDDANWLKWLILNKSNGNLIFRQEKIPIYRYPVKPGNYDKKPHPIQVEIAD